jgi:hypothetical protein
MLLNILSFFGSCESPPPGPDNCGWSEHLGWRRSPSDVQRQQGRRQETDGGPGQRRGGGRAGNQENAVGIYRADRRARQEKRPGCWAATCNTAQTRPAADAALAIWPAPAVPAGAQIRPPEQQPEGRWADTRQCARKQPRSRPGAERAAQGRSARLLGPLVIVPQELFIKKIRDWIFEL